MPVPRAEPPPLNNLPVPRPASIGSAGLEVSGYCTIRKKKREFFKLDNALGPDTGRSFSIR